MRISSIWGSEHQEALQLDFDLGLWDPVNGQIVGQRLDRKNSDPQQQKTL